MMIDVLQHLPNCKVFSTVKQSEDEAAWVAARTRGIGGSDVGSICGVNQYATARTIYFKKVGMYQEPEGGEFSAAAIERMSFGHLLEPIVCDEYSKRSGKKVVTSPATLVHKDYPWALANVDRFIVDDNGIPIGILEAKTAGEIMDKDWKEGELPLSYLYQLTWYMFVTGLKYGALACLVGGNKFYYYDITLNEELLETTILPKVFSFWNHNVANLIEPELDGTQAATDLVNELGKECKKNSEIVIERPEVNELVETFVRCKREIKELETIMDDASNRIKDELREHEIGYTQDYTIKWTPQTQNRIDSETLKINYPEIAEKCMKQITFRKFTVKGVV
jgi:putative phage-type endonuclease